MNFKKSLSIILLACLLVSALMLGTACGSSDSDETTAAATDAATVADTAASTEAGTAATEETTAASTGVTYTVYVKDSEGSAVVGAFVQLCEGENCQFPVATDSEGKAVFTCAEGAWQATVDVDNEKYVHDDTIKYDFPAGKTTLTVTVDISGGSI